MGHGGLRLPRRFKQCGGFSSNGDEIGNAGDSVGLQ